MLTVNRPLWLIAFAVMLYGCASKNPLDYLPQGKLYLIANNETVSSQRGIKKLADISKKLGEPVIDDTQKLYISLSEYSMPAQLYAVFVTKPGAANRLLSQLTQGEKVTPIKIAGLSGFRLTKQQKASSFPGGEMVVVQLSDSACLAAPTEADIEAMIKTARKKNPAASNTQEFSTCAELSNAAPLAIVANVSPFTASLSPASLGPLAKANPKAAAALQNLKLVSFTASWDAQPLLEFVAYTSDEVAARDLATLFNFFVSMQRKQIPPALQNIVAKTQKGDLTISLEVPADVADAWLAKFEQLSEKLPKDPTKRNEALMLMLPSLLQ